MSYKTYEEYKNSGIEWIGEIPEHWNIIKLKFFSEIYGRIGFRGYTASDLVDEGKGAITLGPPNIENQKLNLKEKKYLSWEKYDESPEIKIYNGDLLLVKTASVGKVALVENLNYPTTINPQLTVFKNIQINSKYFYYTMISEIIQHQIASNTNGGVIYTLSQENIRNYHIPLPSNNEQKQIADYLDKRTSEIDKNIAKNKELILLLEEKKTALINQVVTKGLDPNVPMKDSGIEWIGEIPEHWEIIKGKHIFKIYGNSINENNIYTTFKEGFRLIYYYKVDDMNSDKNSLIMSQIEPKYTDVISPAIPKNSILIPKRGAAIATNKVKISLNECYIDSNIMALYTNFNPKFYSYFLYARGLWDIADVSSVPQINNKHINFLEFVLPPIDEQKLIVDYLDKRTSKINQTISKIKENIELLEEYKTSLIHQVVTGKIDVRGEEI